MIGRLPRLLERVGEIVVTFFVLPNLSIYYLLSRSSAEWLRRRVSSALKQFYASKGGFFVTRWIGGDSVADSGVS